MPNWTILPWCLAILALLAVILPTTKDVWVPFKVILAVIATTLACAAARIPAENGNAEAAAETAAWAAASSDCRATN